MFIPVGILSGIVSSTVGLASLVSYPALIAIGLPSVYANVTNTTSLICNGIGAGFGSLKELRGHWAEVIRVFVITFVGAILGSLLLLNFSNQAFSKIAPFFLLIAAVLILWPKKQKSEAELNNKTKPRSKVLKYLAIFAMFLVGAYAGYFGAAAGVVMLALLNYTTDETFPVYNAIRNVALLSANIVSMIIFIFDSHIYWGLVIPLGIGLLIGSYIGPFIVRRVPEKVLKIVVAIASVAMSAWLFYKAY